MAGSFFRKRFPLTESPDSLLFLPLALDVSFVDPPFWHLRSKLTCAVIEGFHFPSGLFPRISPGGLRLRSPLPSELDSRKRFSAPSPPELDRTVKQTPGLITSWRLSMVAGPPRALPRAGVWAAASRQCPKKLVASGQCRGWGVPTGRYRSRRPPGQP